MSRVEFHFATASSPSTVYVLWGSLENLSLQCDSDLRTTAYKTVNWEILVTGYLVKLDRHCAFAYYCSEKKNKHKHGVF